MIEHTESQVGVGRRRHRRAGRTVALGVVGIAALALVGTACGGKKSSSSESTTTTEVVSSSTTRASTSTTAASGGTSGATTVSAPSGILPWDATVGNLLGNTEGNIGKRYSFVCPAGGQIGATVWGIGPYTDDSAVCPAAVHAGLITTAKGGTVTFVVENGSASYAASTANGVTTNDYDSWPRQFSFVK